MSGDTLHFLSEAKLAQTAGFIETGLASLSRLQATVGSRAIDAGTLREFAAMAAAAATLRAQLADDLQSLVAEDGIFVGTYPGVDPPGVDLAVQRLAAASRHVLDRLDEMIGHLRHLQARPGDSADVSGRP